MEVTQTFHKTTENKLEGLFSLLPEILFWTVIVTRLFIALPLFLAAKVHFAFLDSPVLIAISSLVSVLVVESVLTLPSLSTAFFKAHGLKKYQTVAFWTTIILGAFNQSLIWLAWGDTGMSREAFYIYTVLNLASIVLAEFIGFMTAQKKFVPEVETEAATSAPAELDKVGQILSLEAPPNRKIFMLYQEGLTQREIADLVGYSPAKVNRVIRKTPEQNTDTDEGLATSISTD